MDNRYELVVSASDAETLATVLGAARASAIVDAATPGGGALALRTLAVDRPVASGRY